MVKKKKLRFISAVLIIMLLFSAFITDLRVNAEENSEKKNVSGRQISNEPDGVEISLQGIDIDSCSMNVRVVNNSGTKEKLSLYFYENNKELTADIYSWEDLLNIPVSDLKINNGENKTLLKQDNGTESDLLYKVKDNEIMITVPKEISGVFSLRLDNIKKREITIVPVMGSGEDKMPYSPGYITSSLLSDAVASDKTFIAKYTFVPEDIDPSVTIDSIFSSDTYTDNFTLYAELPVYIYDENTYMIKADAPYKNGYINKDPYDVCFARCNNKGEVITKGIRWNNKTKTAYIDAKVLDAAKKDDFADMQMQLLLPCSGSEKEVKLNVSVNNEYNLVETLYGANTMSCRAYDMPLIPIATKETINNITRHEIGIYVNGCPYPLNDDQYELDQMGFITLNTPAALISDIRIDIVRHETELLINCPNFDHSGWTASSFGKDQWAYLKPSVDMSDLKIGDKTNVNLFVDRDGTKVNYGWMWHKDHFNTMYEYGHVYPVCVPRNMFGRDLTFYEDTSCTKYILGVKAEFKNMHTIYNQPLSGYCIHISRPVSGSTSLEQPGWVQLQNIDRSNKNYTAYIFTYQTKEPLVKGGKDGNQALANAFMYRQYHKKVNPEPTWLSIQKVWNDDDNASGRRPGSIKVGLFWKDSNRPATDYYLKDHLLTTKTLDESNNWYYKFTQQNSGAKLVRKDADGTYDWLVEELNVPSGYTCESTWEGDYISGWKGTITNSYNGPGRFNIEITKINEDKLKLMDAEFSIYNDVTCKNKIASGMSDKNGVIKFDDLKINTTYYIKETKAPKGYKIPRDNDGKDIVNKVQLKYNQNNKKGYDLYINDKLISADDPGSSLRLENKGRLTACMTIVNNTSKELPETGTYGRNIIFISGIVIMMLSILQRHKRIKN